MKTKHFEKKLRDTGQMIRHSGEMAAYLFLLVFCVLFVAFIGVTERPDIYSSRTSASVQVLDDVKYVKISDCFAPQGYCFLFHLNLDVDISGQASLVYRTIHEYTEVWLNGRLVYSLYPSEDNIFGKTVGNSWAIVPLYPSDAGKRLDIRIYPVYKQLSYVPDEFLVGQKSDITQREAGMAIPSFILCLVSLTIGLVYIVMSGTEKFNSAQNRQALRCLGLFAILLACWRFCDMRITTLLFPNGTVFFSYTTLLSLMLLPVPLSIYLWTKLGLNRRSLRYLCAGFICVAVAVLFMQLTGIRDVRENLLLIHGCDVAAMFTVLIVLIISEKEHRKANDVELHIGVVLFVFAGISADLVEYYIIGSERNMIWTISSVDFYVIVTGMGFIRQLRREASIDMSTGIYNKNRCMELVNTPGPALAGTMFIMCDLNRLKYVNDNIGHDAGDRMIQLFARVLRKTYSRNSDFVGRFGGDEFVVILNNITSPQQAQLQIHRLQDNVEQARQENPDIPLSFAAGYSLEINNRGENLYFLLRKADMEMYLNKKYWYDANHLQKRAQ